MNIFRKIFAFSVFSIALSACSNDDVVIVDPVPTPTVDLRIIHAVPDAPTVNIYAGAAVLAGLENVDYQVASSWITLDEGSYSVRVEANVPSETVDVIPSTSLALEGEKSYSILAVGLAADTTIEPLVVVSDRSSVTSGNVRVNIVHAAPSAPTVDIYVTVPDADIEVEAPLATASFKDSTGQVEVAGGDYQIRITVAGTKNVVFDSGTVTLPADADLLVVATQNTGTGSSPVTLLVSDGTNFFNIWDINSKAYVRVIHAVSDAPAVDVIANDAITLFDGIGYPDVTAYIAVDAGDYTIDVAVDGDESTVALNDAAISVESGKFYTAIANSDLASIALDVVVDVPRPIATAAKVRIFHASPDASTVDIYVTADGDISSASPAFAGVPFSAPLSETGYVELAAGDYVVTVTGAGSKDAAIETGVLSLEVNKVYTAIAIDGLMADDGPTLITTDDLAAPFSASTTFNITLGGNQEVPTVDTMSSATATVEIDESLPAFKVTLDAKLVTGASAAHVHDGDIGTNGSVAFGLTDMGDGTFVLKQTDITAGLLNDLLSGEWYLNVHTPSNPSGEVRGQIVPDTTVVVTFPLSGLQQIPQVMSDAMAGGYALFDTTNNGVILAVATTGADDATMAHIHTGYAGVNGGVLAPLFQDATDVNLWTSGGEINLDQDTADLLLSGGHYVNVHTPANPSGELRGQITPANIEVYGVVPTGDQEVPAVTTDASGTGAITLNTSTGLIIGTINLFDITPTMAHIHAGEVGTNGGVVLGLTAGDGIFTVPANTVLDMAQIGLMQAEGLYTNFHTTENPSGEIRGQITLGF
jgi:hypothetical protein